MDTIVALVATAHYGFAIAAMSLTVGISVIAAVGAFLRPVERRTIDPATRGDRPEPARYADAAGVAEGQTRPT